MARKIAIIPDLCPMCGTEIREECPTCGRPHALDNHVQFQIKHLPDNLTWVAMCRHCFARMTDKQAREIFEAVKAHFIASGFENAVDWEFIKPIRESAVYESE